MAASGQWNLVALRRPEINKRHHAKVYGKAAVGSAADVGTASRYPRHRRPALAAVRSLCGFSSKFLKHGSLLDLFESVRPANIKPLLSVRATILISRNT